MTGEHNYAFFYCGRITMKLAFKCHKSLNKFILKVQFHLKTIFRFLIASA